MLQLSESVRLDDPYAEVNGHGLAGQLGQVPALLDRLKNRPQVLYPHRDFNKIMSTTQSVTVTRPTSRGKMLTSIRLEHSLSLVINCTTFIFPPPASFLILLIYY